MQKNVSMDSEKMVRRVLLGLLQADELTLTMLLQLALLYFFFFLVGYVEERPW